MNRKYESLSHGELSKKEEEIYKEIENKKNSLLKELDEIQLLNEELKLISKEWNARE